VKDINDMVLGASSVGTTGTGNLTVTVGGALTQSGVLTVTGTTTLAATVASTDINISSQANVLTGAVSIGGTASNVRDFKLRNISISTPATASNFVVGNLTSTSLRDLTIIYDNAAYEIPALTMTSLRNIVITAGGLITQSGAIIQGVAGATASFTNTGTDNYIDLTQELNNFLGAVSFTSDYDVGVTDADALILGASEIGRDFYITTGAGGVTGTGGLTQTGILTVVGSTTLTSSAALTDINLSTQANDLTGGVTIPVPLPPMCRTLSFAIPTALQRRWMAWIMGPPPICAT